MADRMPLSRFWLPFRTLGRRPPSLPPTQPPAKPPTRKSPSPSRKSPQPESSPRAASPALSPSPSRKSPEQEESPSRRAPSPSRTPSKPQPPSPEASPQPPLSRTNSKRRQESPRTSRPPSPTFSTKETQTQAQAIPQEHEPKTSRPPSPSQSPKSSSQPLPPSPSPSTFSTKETQTQAQAIPQEHEPKISRPPSPSPSQSPKSSSQPLPPSPRFSTQETKTQAQAIPQEHEPKTSRPPSPSQSPKSSPQPVSPKYEKQAQPAEEPKKDLEDLEPKPIPTDSIEKQTIPENGVEETRAEKTDVKLDEPELPKPPQPDDKKEENVEESKTKPEAIVETETRIEGVQEEEHKPKPETTMSEKLQIGTIQEREESIDPKRLDPKPPVPHPDTSKLITKIRISKTKKRDDQDDAGGEEPRRNGSDGKESKIKISSIPRASSPTGERTTFQAEVKEGISKLVEKLSIGHSELLGNGNGVMIVTLAGENKGASMVIGYDSLTMDGSIRVHREPEANKNSSKNRKEGSTDARDEICVNSNVQGINNSLLHESSCSEENPGVHLVFSSKPTMPVKTNGKPETIDTVKTIPKTAQAQKLTYTPRVRRRCLRGLLLEPSESDQEDTQKPQRHGCRVSCDGKKNMKADIEDASTSIISWRKIT